MSKHFLLFPGAYLPSGTRIQEDGKLTVIVLKFLSSKITDYLIFLVSIY